MYAIKTSNNDIHCIERNEEFHFKFSLYDIIPIKMKEFYDLKYNALIFGYVKMIENNLKLSSNVPWYLTKMIYSYYPCFL